MWLQEEWEDDDADETADFAAAPDASLADVMSHFAPASDFGGFGDYVDDDDEEDDPDALQDPLYHIQLQVTWHIFSHNWLFVIGHTFIL